MRSGSEGAPAAAIPVLPAAGMRSPRNGARHPGRYPARYPARSTSSQARDHEMRGGAA